VTTTLRAPSRLAAFDELLGRSVSMRSLALLRVFVGPIVLLHLRPFLVDAWHGHIYSDAFYEPYASWYPELPRGVYVGLLFLAAVAAVFMALGLLTRVATATTFVIVTYNLFLSTTHFHNNRAYLVIVLGILAMAPVAQAGPAWPLWLLRFECAAVYGASVTAASTPISSAEASARPPATPATHRRMRSAGRGPRPIHTSTPTAITGHRR